MAKIKICLDAGHYGKYNQAPGVPAYYESEAMWRLQQKLKAALEAWGIQVITTRADRQKDRDLYDRGYAAKGCDLFLSLHSNAADRKTADFVRAYHLTEDSGTDVDEISKAIAQKLAPVIAETMGVREGWEALSRLAASDKNKDGMKNDNYYGVLNGARQAEVPGIILEHSFHTNDDMARWLLEDANLDALAQAEADAIAACFGVEKPAEAWYRIRKTWDDPQSQKGAYRDLDNAIANCPDGYKVYGPKGEQVYPEKPAVQPQEPEHDFTLGFRYLRTGCKGEDVRALQRLLIAAGYSCGPDGADGDFGNQTRAALIRYQADHGMGIDGVAGPKTVGCLLGI